MTCECGVRFGVALRRGFVERLAEQEELELRREHHRVAERGGALDLALQDAAGRHLDRFAVSSSTHVAQHERGRFEPRDAADRREVGLHRDVAVALLPVRELVAGQRRHVDVDREQVVARVNRLRPEPM